MKRLFSIFTLLLCFIAGAWAQDFTVATSTTNYDAIEEDHYYVFKDGHGNDHYFNGASNKTNSLSEGQIYKIVAASTSGKVLLQCYSGEYQSKYVGVGESFVTNGVTYYNLSMVENQENAVEFTVARNGNNDAQVRFVSRPIDENTDMYLGAQGCNNQPSQYQPTSKNGDLSYWNVYEVTFYDTPQAKIITTYESATNYLMTVDPNFLALAGTGAHFGLNVVNSAGQNHQWLNLVDATKAEGNVLTTDRLFQLANSTTNGCYWIQNYAGNYMTAAGVFGSDTEGLNLTVTNTAAGSDTNGYNSQTEKQIRFNKTGSSDNFRFRSGAVYDFDNVTGSWTGFVAFGPFYVVTIQHKNGETILDSSTAIYSGGELTVNANYYDGLVADESSVTTTINRDMTITFNYQTADAELITTEAAARANHLLTYEQFMAKINAAQPSGRFAFRWLNSNGTQHWRNLKDNTASENLTKEFLNSFTKHGECWWITNYAGQHLNGRDGNGGTFGETGVDFNITNDAVDSGDLPTYFTTDNEIRFKRASDNKYYGYPRSNTPDFGTGTGGYMGFAAYGPFYVVTVQAKCGGEVVGTVEYIYSAGNASIAAPAVNGYTCSEEDQDIFINEDKTLVFNYTEADSYDVTFHKYEASEEKAYATVYVSFNAELPEGVKAYSAAVSAKDPEVLELTAIEGGVLPAYTPAILSSTTAVTGENLSAAVTFSKSLETPATVDNNSLEGTVSTTQAPESGYDYYVLGKKSGIAFYKYTASVLPHHRAWIRQAQNAGSNALRLRFADDVTTYIDAIESSNSKAEIYDLQGRRLRQAQPGMNIINGQKVLVK